MQFRHNHFHIWSHVCEHHYLVFPLLISDFHLIFSCFFFFFFFCSCFSRTIIIIIIQFHHEPIQCAFWLSLHFFFHSSLQTLSVFFLESESQSEWHYFIIIISPIIFSRFCNFDRCYNFSLSKESVACYMNHLASLQFSFPPFSPLTLWDWDLNSRKRMQQQTKNNKNDNNKII